MFFQERVHDRCKFVYPARHWATDKISLDFCPGGTPVRALRELMRHRSGLVGDTRCLLRIEHAEKHVKGGETAGETRIRMELDKDFLDFVNGKPGGKAVFQGWFQFLRVAAGSECRDGG